MFLPVRLNFMMKSKFKLLGIFIILGFGQAQADCYSNNVPEIQKFLDNVVNIPITSDKYSKEKLILEEEIELIKAENEINETSLSFKYDVKEKSNALNLRSDLSFWKRKYQKQINDKKVSLKKIELQNLESGEYAELALSIVSILSSESYLAIFQERRLIFEELIDYYERRIQMGSGEFQQKMETEQNLIELSNKEMSAEIKKETQLLLNNLEMSNLNDFIFPLGIKNYSENISCQTLPGAIASLDLQIDLVNMQIEEERLKLSPSLLGSVASVWDENGDNETTSSLVFNLSIYNGNKRKLQKSKIEQELNKIENQRSILLMELERALEERMKIDKILLSSLNSLDDQLENKIDTLNQFYLKQQLGGSAFEEKMQVMREISVLKEARIGLLADFYNAWIGFINARGDIKR